MPNNAATIMAVALIIAITIRFQDCGSETCLVISGFGTFKEEAFSATDRPSVAHERTVFEARGN